MYIWQHICLVYNCILRRCDYVFFQVFVRLGEVDRLLKMTKHTNTFVCLSGVGLVGSGLGKGDGEKVFLYQDLDYIYV